MSSFNDIIIGSGNNIEIISNKYTTLESSNIYLGKQAQEKKEPIVLGTKLKDFLKKLVDTLAEATALVQGVPVPLTDAQGKPLLTKIQGLQSDLTSPSFWSDYHYIEENGQKN